MSNENLFLTGEDIDVNKDIFVNGFPLFGKNIMILTTNKEIIDKITYLKNYPNSHLENQYSKLYKECIGINHLNIIKNMKSNKKFFKKKWEELCENILNAYLIRFILTNKYIPIVIDDNIKNNIDLL